jgi:hypothetical protein
MMVRAAGLSPGWKGATMATKAMKIIGTKIKFGEYYLDEVTDVGRGRQVRNQKKIVSCDSEEDNADYLDLDIERGTIDFTFVYEGEIGGTYDSLQEDFDSGEIKTLEVTYKNGSKKSFLAKIVALDTAGGAAEGGHAEGSVSFQRQGPIDYTPVSEVTV